MSRTLDEILAGFSEERRHSIERRAVEIIEEINSLDPQASSTTEWNAVFVACRKLEEDMK